MNVPFQPIAPQTAAEERDAIQAAQAGDPAAVETLVRAQVRYVAGEARKMASATVSEEDLLQVGLSALVQAVRTFDLSREGVRLIVHAKPRIREAMNEERAGATTAMAIPGRTLRRFEQARRATSTMDAAADFAEGQGMDRKTFFAVADALNGAVHLDAPVSDESGASREREVLVGDALQPVPQPEPTAVNRADVARIFDVAGLDARSERVVRLAFGFAGEPLSDADIAKATGLSRQSVGRIRNEAMAVLRRVAGA